MSNLLPSKVNANLPKHRESGADGKTQFTVDVVVPIHDPRRNFERMVRSALYEQKSAVRVIAVLHNLTADQKHQVIDRLRAVGEVETATDANANEGIRILVLDDGIPGPAAPFNLGLSAAESPWVSKGDSDDELAPGAIDHWVGIGEQTNADAVLARITDPTGVPAATPPMRNPRRTLLDPMKDRLYYRSSPMGLIRRQAIVDLGLEMATNAQTGEDIAFLAPLFSKGVIASGIDGPGYLELDDAPTRATTTLRPISEDFKGVLAALEPKTIGQLSKKQRDALGTKLLRRDAKEIISKRLHDAEISAEDGLEIGRVIADILRSCPSALGNVSAADLVMLQKATHNSSDVAALTEALDAAQDYRSWKAIRPARLINFFSAQAPLRYHLASLRLRRWYRRLPEETVK